MSAYRTRFAAANSLPLAHGPMPSPAFAAAADTAACSSSVSRSVTMCERGLSDGGRPVRGFMLPTIASTESLANPDLCEYGKSMTTTQTSKARLLVNGEIILVTNHWYDGDGPLIPATKATARKWVREATVESVEKTANGWYVTTDQGGFNASPQQTFQVVEG